MQRQAVTTFGGETLLDFVALKLRLVSPEEAARQFSSFMSRQRETGPLVLAVANSLVLAVRGEGISAMLQLAEALGVSAALEGLAARAGVAVPRGGQQPLGAIGLSPISSANNTGSGSGSGSGSAANPPVSPTAAGAASAAAAFGAGAGASASGAAGGQGGQGSAADADPERERAWVELLGMAGECAAQGRCSATEARSASNPRPRFRLPSASPLLLLLFSTPPLSPTHPSACSYYE